MLTLPINDTTRPYKYKPLRLFCYSCTVLKEGSIKLSNLKLILTIIALFYITSIR